MELFNEILHGMKTGEYWFISLATYLYMFCVLMLLVNQRRYYKTDADQVKSVDFSARMVLASIAILYATVLYVVIPGPYLKYALIVVCAIILVMMIKVDKLPIWEDRE